MKINNDIYNHIAKLYKSYQANQAPAEQAGMKSVSTAGTDSVQLSEQALKINELIKAAKELPEVREEKIARIKEEIANHTYNVSARQLAEKMLAGDKE